MSWPPVSDERRSETPDLGEIFKTDYEAELPKSEVSGAEVVSSPLIRSSKKGIEANIRNVANQLQNANEDVYRLNKPMERFQSVAKLGHPIRTLNSNLTHCWPEDSRLQDELQSIWKGTKREHGQMLKFNKSVEEKQHFLLNKLNEMKGVLNQMEEKLAHTEFVKDAAEGASQVR